MEITKCTFGMMSVVGRCINAFFLVCRYNVTSNPCRDVGNILKWNVAGSESYEFIIFKLHDFNSWIFRFHMKPFKHRKDLITSGVNSSFYICKHPNCVVSIFLSMSSERHFTFHLWISNGSIAPVNVFVSQTLRSLDLCYWFHLTT